MVALETLVRLPFKFQLLFSSEDLSSNNFIAIFKLLEFNANSFPGWGKRSAEPEDSSRDPGAQPLLKPH
jgi:hypothetical protein